MKTHRLTDILLLIFLVFWFFVIFVVPSPQAREATFVLEIPEETCVVGTFGEFRTLKEEYQLLTKLYFAPGKYSLPLESGEYNMYLFNKLEFGPERELGVPRRSGNVTVERQPNRIFYKFEHDIDIGDRVMHVTWDSFSVQLENEVPTEQRVVLGEPYLSTIYLIGTIEIDGETKYVDFASETYEGIPAWRKTVELTNGQSIELYYRYNPPMAGSGPANLIYAEVNVEGYRAKQASYWKLVYSAGHHNWDEKFLILFDAPIGDAYGIVFYGVGNLGLHAPRSLHR